MLRSLAFSLVVLTAAAAVAWANPPTAQPLVQRIEAAKSPADRKAAVDALVALDPQPVSELATILARTRTSTDAGRRAILSAQKFDVPDEKGHFANPARQTEAQEKANDRLDWLAPLYKQPASPALGDLLVDLAVIRALAASQTSAAAKAILDFAFTPDGIAYRDECGRFLRRMSPWSLPALIMAAKGWHVDASKRRYARYQLERLDREAPRKALNDATTDDLKVEILNAFAESKYREAVYAVLDTVDDPSPAVRKAARAAWMEYATGKPHYVPKEKLKVPGGKLTDKPVPLWLDHRELADIAIRRRLEELGKKPPALPGLARLGAALLTQYDERRKKRFDQALKADLAKRTTELFAYYDEQRKQKLDQELEATLAAARTGPLKDAAERLDSILVQAPDYARRGEMADVYLRYGKELTAAGKWHDAAIEFGKANAVAPSGPLAEQAMSLHHEARGHALEQAGKSGADELAHAHEIKATLGKGAGAAADGGSRSWMLGFGIAGGIAGMILVALGFALRRRGR